MKNKVDEILKAPYSRLLIPDENGTFAAEILEFPGCFAQGNTPNEAFKNLEKTARAWIESSLARGLDIPQPSINVGYSGRIALRIPRSLHKKSAQFAERDGVSLNHFLITAIASRIGAEEYHVHLCNNFEKLLTYTTANTISFTSTVQQIFVYTDILTLLKGTDTAQIVTQGSVQGQVLDHELTYINIDQTNNLGLISQETKTRR